MNNQAFSKIWIVVIIVILLAGGILVWQFWWAPEKGVKAPEEKIEEVMPEEKVPEEEIKDETADWKTYRNEAYGFEFKYPKEWGVSETPKEILTQLTNPYYKNLLSETMFCYSKGATSESSWCGVLVSIYQRPADLLLKEFYETKEKLYGLRFNLQKEEDLILGNQIHATKFIFTSTKPDTLTSEVIVAIEKEGEIIEIKDKWAFSLEDLEFAKVFNQMLSTFRFME